MPEYQYSDGNGNLYLLMGNRLSYDPVTTIESSSGIYSGGSAWEKEISDDQIETLVSLIEAAFANRTFRSDKRTLGSGEIRIITDEQTRRVILAMRSPDKKKIEDFLEAFGKQD